MDSPEFPRSGFHSGATNGVRDSSYPAILLLVRFQPPVLVIIRFRLQFAQPFPSRLLLKIKQPMTLLLILLIITIIHDHARD